MHPNAIKDLMKKLEEDMKLREELFEKYKEECIKLTQFTALTEKQFIEENKSINRFTNYFQNSFNYCAGLPLPMC